MDCERVRDRFSSLWEKELTPLEEEDIRGHLSSCPECHREFEQFEKTMGWLRSVEEAEVPEGFLSELQKKVESRRQALPGAKPGGRGFHFPPSLKLPAQAAAMVVVVFLVLYLTKMVPIEGIRTGGTPPIPSPLSAERKSETILTQKETEKEPSAFGTPTGTGRPKGGEQVHPPVPIQKELEEASPPPLKAESKKAEAPASSAGAVGYKAVDSNEAARGKPLSPEPGRAAREQVVKEKSAAASESPREIVLRVADREKVISPLLELVKRFGGEVVATEKDAFLASLPTNSFSEFEKELAGLSSSGKTDLLPGKKDAAERWRFEEGVKKEEGSEKGQGRAKPAAEGGNRSIIRIRLVEK